MQSSSLDMGVAKSRACENCSRAKAKCISQSIDISSQQCARCLRLKKDCVVLPRAKRKKRALNAVGTAELGSKIERLANLLSAAQGAQGTKVGHAEAHGMSLSPEVNLRVDSTFSKSSNNVPTEGIQPSSVDSILPSSTLITTSGATPPRDPTPVKTASTQHSIVTPVTSPDDLLQVFRLQFMVQFPYAIIAPDVTAIELREKKPWLYRMIMMAVSSHERHQQMETGKILLSEISTAILTRGERSLDMLQALLVYATWSHLYASMFPQNQSSGIIQLALTLVYDLAINRAVRDDGETARFVLDAIKKGHLGERSDPREAERSLDDRRAYLYAFYLSSTAATNIRKIDGLQPSPYLEYCCKILEEAAEYDADLLLVACVRFQSIADSVHRALPNRLSHSDGRNAPVWMHTSHLQNELQSILKRLSRNLQNDVIVRLSYHSVEVFLIDCAILETWNDPTFNSRRIDLRWSSLMASKSLLDAFFTLPVSAYSTISLPSMSQISFCLMNVFKLSFIQDPGWDLVHVRETVNLAPYFDNLASNLGQVGATIDSLQKTSAKESFLTSCSRAMAWVKGMYNAKVAAELDVGRTPGHQTTGMMDLPDEMFNYNASDCMDENYWQELMADFSYGLTQQSDSNNVN